MEKIYEKKNLGIPVTILTVLSYFIGYSLTRSLSGTLLIAVLFAGAVFSLQFDDRVKNAIKHSYIFAFLFYLLYLVFNFLESFTSMLYSGRMPSLNVFQDGFFGFGIVLRALTFMYTYGLIIVNIATVIMFGLFILLSLLNKDINFSFVKKILGEAPPKANKQPAPVNQQPVQQAPVQQPTQQAPVQQPVQQAPVQQPTQAAPVQNSSMACSNCGKVNKPEAKFCSSCGSKLN